MSRSKTVRSLHTRGYVDTLKGDNKRLERDNKRLIKILKAIAGISEDLVTLDNLNNMMKKKFKKAGAE